MSNSPSAPWPNFRDIGGLINRSGQRLRQGLIFRSSAPALDAAHQLMPEAAQETFEGYMATEAREVFESVMQRLLKDLVSKGRTNREAEELARRHATIHVQNKYRQKQKEQGITGF